MTTGDVSILQRVLGVHGPCVSANCFMLFLQWESWESVKVGSYPTQIFIRLTWAERMFHSYWISRHYIKHLIHDFCINKSINIRIVLIYYPQHKRHSQFNFGKFYLSQFSRHLWVLLTSIYLHPDFLLGYHSLSNSLSLGFGLKSLFPSATRVGRWLRPC